MTVHTIVLAAITIASASGSEIISDLTVGTADETAALQVKAKEFWGSILESAQKAKMAEHAQLYKDADEVLAAMSGEHADAKQALSDSLHHLQHADDLVLAEAVQSTKLAAEEMRKPIASSQQTSFSFMAGGQMLSIFKDSLRRFASEGTYSQHLVELVEKRQAGVMPILQGELQITADVLRDCHAAAQRSFDMLKQSVYDKKRLRGQRGGSPTKLPDAAKSIANRVIKASQETRSRFTELMMETVMSIARDTRGKREQPAATLVRASEATKSLRPAHLVNV